jgi:protein-disulfide isomerase
MKYAFKPLLLLALLSSAAFAADATSSLKPPPGARVAIVVFEDLECPSCANAYPQVWQIANQNKVSVELRDYIIPTHHWSMDAAVFARFFDEQSPDLGRDFRGYIYSNQTQITRANLRQYVNKFASDKKVPVPFVIDADGSLKQKVLADSELGRQLGIGGTPTIYVVGNGGAATPAVQSPLENLSQTVQEMLAKSPAPAKTPAKAASAKKKAAKKAQ